MGNIIYKKINNPYGFVYITTNMVNGKRYLGQKKFDKKDKWKTYLGSGTAFKQAVRKYGEENFVKNIVCICYSIEELNQIEHDLSVYLDVVKSPDWYNLVYGGSTMAGYSPPIEVRKKLSKALKGKPAPNKGIPMSEETKRKISERYSGENAIWYGKHHTEESKEKIRQARTGTKASKETREKMSKQRTNSMSYFYGHYHSEESKIKMSEAKKGEKSVTARPVVQLTKDGKFIKEWLYIKQASDELGILATNISYCCRHGGSSVGGFIWVYKDEYNPSKSYKCTNHTKHKVVQLTLDNKFISEYESVSQASKSVGVSSSSISNYCRGISNPSGEYKWMYADEYYKQYCI